MSAQNFYRTAKKILIVIVNYRTPTLTIDCLHSLVNEVQSLNTISVVIIDNNSGDRSLEQIEAAINAEGWRNWATTIAGDRNGGYAYGNNLAIRPALDSSHPPDYIVLLNPDTIVRSGAIKTLVDFMEEHPHIGIAGSRLEDPDGTPQCSAFRFHTHLSELNSGLRLGIVSKLLCKWIIAPPVSDVTCKTDWVAGASMIIRREVFEAVGLLDEDYFMYYEEVDFCLQAKKAGWDCWYVPESRVVHLVGQSSGVTNTKVPPKRRPQYWFDSRRRYFLKNHGASYAVLADFFWLFSFIIWRGRRIIQGKPDTDPPYFLTDFVRHSLKGISDR
ncbi:MAG: glycosyltransferase family 2 protein [Hydrococcus sp. CRU_1_1]|nr:glycosyltransferase family 2 protein [Hydrococcus sp. CRU_1_1]NJQ97412.1 glycosyltransferase family 2 protein [Hydrococcus sp. CSU_1_8]